jgi:hypothetical protein
MKKQTQTVIYWRPDHSKSTGVTHDSPLFLQLPVTSYVSYCSFDVVMAPHALIHITTCTFKIACIHIPA